VKLSGTYAMADIAVESYKRSSGYVLEEYLPALIGTNGKRTMRLMIDDPTYGAVLFILGVFFRSMQWSVELPKELVGDADAETRRAYLEDVLMRDIGTKDDPDSLATFDDLVAMALDMCPWGYSLVNPVLKKRPDGLVGIGRLIQIAAETVDEWIYDEATGKVTGVKQQNPATYVITPIEREYFLHFKTNPAKGSPEGRSIFRASYKSWKRREALQTTESILAERGTGFPVIIADPKIKEQSIGETAAAKVWAQTVSQIESIPKNVRMNSQSGLTLWTDNYKNPDGTDTGNPRVQFQFAPVGTTNTVQFREAIRDYDMQIVRSVIAQFLFNGSDSGNRALDSSQTSSFLRAIMGFAEIIATVVNRQLVTRLWTANGWEIDNTMPRVTPSPLDKSNLEEIGSYIQKLTAAGATIFPNPEIEKYLLTLADVPVDSIGEDEEL